MLKKSLVYILLILGAITVLFPFVWMLLTSFKTYSEAVSVPPVFFPANLLFSNYSEAFDQAPFLIYTVNSIIAAVFSTIFVLITSVLAAFAFVRYDFKFKNILLALLIATLMIPGELMIITNFQTIAQLGLYNTRIAIFLPYTASVFYIYLVLQFFQTVPNELYLAAKVDGTSDFKFLTKVLVPVSKPILITIALLNIIGSWNSYLWPTLIVDDVTKRTLPFGLIQFQTEAGSEIQLIMAATTFIILPIIVLFILSRKYIVSGLTKGAIKG